MENSTWQINTVNSEELMRFYLNKAGKIDVRVNEKYTLTEAAKLAVEAIRNAETLTSNSD